MAAFNYAILFCLVCIAFAAKCRNPQTCIREDGDVLLFSESLLGIVIETGTLLLNQTFPGYVFTCVRCTTFLGGQGDLLNITILEGGYYCNSVIATINSPLNDKTKSCSIYGRKTKAGECEVCI